MTDHYNFGGVYLYICVIIIKFVALTFWCVRRRRRKQLESEILNNGTTYTASDVYSVTQMPPPGGYQTNVTVASCPTHQQMKHHMAPYPPMAAQSSAMNPPPYDVTVAGARYPKQAPYNPSVTAQ